MQSTPRNGRPRMRWPHSTYVAIPASSWNSSPKEDRKVRADGCTDRPQFDASARQSSAHYAKSSHDGESMSIVLACVVIAGLSWAAAEYLIAELFGWSDARLA